MVAICCCSPTVLVAGLFPRPRSLHVPQAAGLRFAGIEEGRFTKLHGVFTVDPEQPVANGRPHYRTAAGGHLYYHSGSGMWLLDDECTPDTGSNFTSFATAGAVPVGSESWKRVDMSLKSFVDVKLTVTELTVAELTAAEVAAAERAAEVAAAR